jgi:Protein ENHANCED DISEASE RESISTANCE 2, C-terminal/START domain
MTSIGDEEASVSLASFGMQGTPPELEVVLEGKLWKLNRSRVWQNRYFVFYSNQVLSYSHLDDDGSRQSFFITSESGCEMGEIFVEQKGKGTAKESLYCFTISWPDDNTTVGSNNRSSRLHESIIDDGSLYGPLQTESLSPENSNHRTNSRLANAFKNHLRPKIPVRHNSAPAKSGSFDDKGVDHENPPNATADLKNTEHGHSLSWNSLIDPDERSISSVSTPVGHQGLSGWLKGRNGRQGQLEKEAVHTNTKNQKPGEPRQKPRDGCAVPSFVSIKGEHATIHERAGEEDHVSPPATPLRETNNKELGNKSEHRREQEKLHAVYDDTQRKEKKAMRKKVVEGTKVAVAAGAAAGVGVITAGVGLVAGLAALGAAAAVGGTASVAEVGLKRKFQKSGKLTIATTSFESTKLWKSTLDACLQSEALKESTWAQMFMADGRRTTTALLPHDLEVTFSRSREDLAATVSRDTSPSRFQGVPKGQSRLFLHDRNLLQVSGSSWRPLEGGWVTLLGPGAQSLRISREERIRMEANSEKVARLAVHGSTCTPLKTHVVLKSPPLDAFMCLMSYARLPKLPADGSIAPNAGQSASFRVLEKIDEHNDIVHMVCRKLYLFPSWTEPRDFVLFRYWRYETDGSYTICYESIEHPSCPPRPDFVRGDMHQAYTIAPLKAFARSRKSAPSSAAECLLTAVTQVDPKGWVPSKPWSFLSNQSYADAFGVAVLLQLLDVRDAIEHDRFLEVSPDLHPPVVSSGKSKMESSPEQVQDNDALNYDVRFSERERSDGIVQDSLAGLETTPPPLKYSKWAEPDANSFLVRGPTYKKNRVKINAGASIGRLVAVDLVLVDKPILTGMSTHPSERIQLALSRERKLKHLGKQSDMPPFVFMVNIILPGPPFYHAVYYYAVDNMSTIDGSNGTGSSRLCQRFLFGESDDFRDRTFKLIPQIVEGNFMVRKAVGSTPAIMGTKLQQFYVRSDRYMEVILNCGSSAVATGVIRLSLGYAKTLVVDMGFLLEADEEEYLPERIFGCARMKHVEFGPGMLRKVEDPTENTS